MIANLRLNNNGVSEQRMIGRLGSESGERKSNVTLREWAQLAKIMAGTRAWSQRR